MTKSQRFGGCCTSLLNPPFAVVVSGTKTTGVVRCDQPRVIDLAARDARKVDTLPEVILDEVL
eukprot:gene50726-67909_t